MTTTAPISSKPVENKPSCALSRVGKIAYGAMFLGALGLAASGIGTFALGKAPMTHWILMAHVSAAPLFAIGLAFVALTWARPSCFGDGDALPKALLWLILLAGVVVILSGVVPMTPVFGTSGQHRLYLVHRYGGIVMALTMGLHLLSLRRSGCRS